MEIKNVDSESFLSIESIVFSNAVRHLSHLADNLEIQTNTKRVRFCVKGNFSSGFVEFS